jgi:hypothetical protein
LLIDKNPQHGEIERRRRGSPGFSFGLGGRVVVDLAIASARSAETLHRQ